LQRSIAKFIEAAIAFLYVSPLVLPLSPEYSPELNEEDELERLERGRWL